MPPEQATTHANPSWKQTAEICWVFLKISPVTFGGGYSMIPLIGKEIVGKHHWLTEREMEEAVMIGGTAPGGIGVNTAVFIGYKLQGWRGLLAALLGIVSPTFLIVIGLFLFFSQIYEHPAAAAAIQGIQAGVVALIAHIGYKLFRSSIRDNLTLLLFIVGLGLLLFFPVPPLLLLISGILLGIATRKFRLKNNLPTKQKKTSSEVKEAAAKYQSSENAQDLRADQQGDGKPKTDRR